MENNLFLKEALSPRLLLIDGIGRAGKFLAAKIVSHLDRVEYFMFHTPVEQISQMSYLGLLPDSTAQAFLRLQIDIALTDRIAGRSFNLRRDDASCLFHAPDYELYEKRTLQPDLGVALETFNADNRYPSFITHELLPVIHLFFAITEDLKVLETIRHPIDMAYSWYNRGWGERFGYDPLAFVPTIEHDGQPVPWFAATYAADYTKASPIDRVLMFVLKLLKMCEKSLEALSPEQRSCIHMLPYEYLLMDPEREITKLADFLGTQPLDTLAGLIKSENLKGRSTTEPIREKFQQMQEIATPRLIDPLVEAGREYELLYGLEPAISH